VLTITESQPDLFQSWCAADAWDVLQDE